MCDSSWPFFMRSALAPRAPERVAALLEVAELVVARAGGSEQDDVARPRVLRSRAERPSRGLRSARGRRPPARARTAMSPAASPIRIRARGSPGEVERKLGVALALAAPAEDDVQRRVVGRDGAPGRSGVRRLRVVHVAHAARLGDQLESMGDAREGLERIRDARVVDAERAGRRRGRRGVLAVVRAGDARLGRQRIGRRRTRSSRAARDLVEAMRDDRVSPSPWFSKMRSFASR